MKVERPSATTEPIKNQNDDSELGIMIMVLLIAGVFIIIRVKDSDWYTSRDYRKKSKIYDSSGFNCYGVHRNGTRYDENGYNQDGFDANGYDSNGYNKAGFDVNGYDSKGFDKDGYNKDGINALGKKRPNKYIEINSKQISKKDLKPDKFGNITCPYCKSKVTTYWKRCPKCDEPFDFLKD